MVNIAFCHVPLVTVDAQRLASGFFNLDQADVVEACLLHAQGLAACTGTGADFDG